MPSRQATKADLASEIWRRIFDLIVKTAPQRSRTLAELKLTPNDSRAVASLDDIGRPMGDLAAEWQCDASTATWIVDRLEAKGLAERRPHATDRRTRLVVLTPLGRETRARLFASTYTPPAELLALDRADLVLLRDAVRRLP